MRRMLVAALLVGATVCSARLIAPSPPPLTTRLVPTASPVAPTLPPTPTSTWTMLWNVSGVGIFTGAVSIASAPESFVTPTASEAVPEAINALGTNNGGLTSWTYTFQGQDPVSSIPFTCTQFPQWVFVANPGTQQLVCLNSTSGGLIWVLDVVVGGAASLTCTKDVIVLQQPNYLIGVKAANGAALWQRYVNTTNPYTTYPLSIDAADAVAYADSTGVWVASVKDGSNVFSTPLRLPEGVALVSVSSNILIAAGWSGTYGYDASSGMLVWKSSFIRTHGGSDTWAAVGASGNISFFYTATGKAAWTWNDVCTVLNVTGTCDPALVTLAYSNVSRPIIAVNRSATVPAAFGAFDAHTGKLLWTIANDQVPQTATSTPNYIWFGGFSATSPVVVVRVENGEQQSSGITTPAFGLFESSGVLAVAVPDPVILNDLIAFHTF